MQPSMASTGNGQSVMGRNRPALMPSARARTTAACAMRAVAPKAHEHDLGVLAHDTSSARCSRGFHRLIALETLDVQALELVWPVR